MLSSQPPARHAPHFAPSNAPEQASSGPFDDDLAIGCECANPALQIERWAQEGAAQPLRQFSKHNS